MPFDEDAGVFTIGHSTRPLAELIELLEAQSVALVLDVRTIPRSRRNPQYESETLRQGLADAGIDYQHLPALGGLRKPRADSSNGFWRNDSFRGYADYMQTAEFGQALELLLDLAGQRRLAILCAEAVPWRCHRSMIADALTARGMAVHHIVGRSRPGLHQLNPAARLTGEGKLYYPGDLSEGGTDEDGARAETAEGAAVAHRLQNRQDQAGGREPEPEAPPLSGRRRAMPRGASPKREREYEDLKGRFKKEGRYKGRETQVAARIVNKQRSQYGETKKARKEEKRGESPDRDLPIKGYRHLTVSEIKARLGKLTAAQRRKIRQYEISHKNRKTLLRAIDGMK